jgi:hypothetical protein
MASKVYAGSADTVAISCFSSNQFKPFSAGAFLHRVKLSATGVGIWPYHLNLTQGERGLQLQSKKTQVAPGSALLERRTPHRSGFSRLP